MLMRSQTFHGRPGRALELASAGAVPDLTVAGSNPSRGWIRVMHGFASKLPLWSKAQY